jgi:glycosyltransferase involved in cell wall biosynthesis
MTLRVYISGQVNGPYRAPNIIKTLADHGISVTHMPTGAYRQRGLPRTLQRFITVLAVLLSIPVRISSIALSTHVVILPMDISAMVRFEFLVARILKKVTVVDYYISMFDMYVNDHAIVAPSSRAAKRLRKIDQTMMGRSSITLFLNHAERKYYETVVGVSLPDRKCRIISLCADYRSEFFRSPKEDDDSGGARRLNVCWWGTYIPLHGLETIIRAFSFIQNAQIHLFLFGDSDEKAIPYLELIDGAGLSDRISIRNDYSFGNGKLAPCLVEHCDIGLGNFGTSSKAKTVLVNKVVDCLAFGIPCLTMPTEASRELLVEGDGIIYSEPESRAIAEVLEDLAADRYDLKQIGSRGVAKYLETFSPDVFKKRFMEVLNESQMA